MTDSTLMTHCGATTATIEEVRAVPVPDPDDSWHPIPHGLAVDLLEKSIESHGFGIRRRQFALQDGRIEKRENQTWAGAKLFGVYDLTLPWASDGDEFSMAMGVRNSMDMSFAYSLVGGDRVFVCDNLAFSGVVEMRKKHTANILDGLEGLVSDAVLQTSDLFVSQAERFEAWKALELSVEEATDFVCEVQEEGALPIRGIPAIRALFRDGEAKGGLGGYEEFRAPTVWSLYNHFSEFAKSQRINALDHARRSSRQSELFRRRFPVLPSDQTLLQGDPSRN
jgi:hypothetical protein